jgi:hypothetical protein
LTLLVEGQLFPQEEILSGENGAGLEETAQESDEVQTEVVKGQEGARKGIVVSENSIRTRGTASLLSHWAWPYNFDNNLL